MLEDLFFRHLVTLFLILLFSIKLWSRKSFRDTDTRYLWLTVISCIILVFEDSLEAMAAQDPALRFVRILLSVIGYNFRSVAALSLLLVILPQKKRKFYVWIPCIINLLACCTAFFTDIAFGYDENYAFRRGPLGYVSFAVPLIYLLLILWNSFRRIADRSGAEKYIVLISVVFCLCASAADILGGGIRTNEAIMISSVFFYIFLYSNDNRRDPLTGLLNRQAFYDDCALFEKNIGAVSSMDMNGLKELNDSKGHQAGDDALVTIGSCIKEATDRDSRAYRIGGDEFVVLFFHDRDDTIDEVNQKIKKSVADSGYNLAAGYSISDPGISLEGAIKESDRLMYEDKARFYRENGQDRKRR